MAVGEYARIVFAAHGGERNIVRAGIHAFRDLCRGIKHFQIDADIELFDRRFHGIADLLVFLGHQQIDVGDIGGTEIAAHLLALFKIVWEQFA